MPKFPDIVDEPHICQHLVISVREIKLTADQVYSDNEEVVRINSDNPYVIPMLEATDFGNANICYNHNGEVYKIPVTVGLAVVDFYNTTSPSEEAFLDKLSELL